MALLVFALGYAAGVYHGAIRQSIGDVFPVLGVVSGSSGIDAGEDAYAKGRYPLALRLMQPLAEQGDARAQAVMGLMYYHGRGVKQDDVEAAKWFRLAADQDEPRAQFNLGVMHAEGQGVPQDYVEAIKWYRLAAEQGEARAQFNLGVSYAEGQGTDQNYILAYMWFNLAAPRFLPSEADRRRVALHNRDLTASRMSREQIAEAQTDVARVAAERHDVSGRMIVHFRVRQSCYAARDIVHCMRGQMRRSSFATRVSTSQFRSRASKREHRRGCPSPVFGLCHLQKLAFGICRRPWIPELRTHPAG